MSVEILAQKYVDNALAAIRRAEGIFLPSGLDQFVDYTFLEEIERYAGITIAVQAVFRRQMIVYYRQRTARRNIPPILRQACNDLLLDAQARRDAFWEHYDQRPLSLTSSVCWQKEGF